MPTTLRPGVFPSEVDFSQYIKGVGTSAFGLVGVFSKGPVNVATLVTSFTQAQALFGTYLDATGYYGMLALKSFFANGGTTAYVVRITHVTSGASTSVAGTSMLVDRAGSPVNTLKVSAINQGVWGNSLTVDIVASSAYPTTGFNLKVNLSGVLVETFTDLLIGTANVADKDYCHKRINGISAYIVVADQLSVTAAPNNRPAIAAGSAFTTGNDGLSGLTVADYLGTSSTGNGLYALGGSPVNLVAIPGAVDATSAFGGALNAGIVTYVESRKDCLALLDLPQGQTVSTLVDFRNGTGSYSHAAFNSSYAANYALWPLVTHPITGAQTKAPPSAFVAGICARVDNTLNVWTAPAGLNQGLIFDAVSAEMALQPGDEDTLYSNNINYLTTKIGSLVVWGQKTLQIKDSALNRVNVRRLMCFIEGSINAATLFFIDKPNTVQTWQEFKRTVNPYLQTIKDGQGLYDFFVVCDATINNAAAVDSGTMNAVVNVKPVRAVDFIPIQYSIALSGAQFPSS